MPHQDSEQPSNISKQLEENDREWRKTLQEPNIALLKQMQRHNNTMLKANGRILKYVEDREKRSEMRLEDFSKQNRDLYVNNIPPLALFVL